MLTEIQPVDFGAPVTKAGGSLNAMPGTVAKPEKVTTDVTINITADEDLVTNGLVTVTYDPRKTNVEMLLTAFERIGKPAKVVKSEEKH